ncbi:hypothetical protein HAPAU_32210 [Halalkalicoccus paucihalophilus]|uniref:Uncharacterized protein n=1 Tax=Halalkalicoccus paucihalophilus TaxID=1008153 RepID=A0A151AB76_9EURY|nr:hypothetical protein HAPAU_32210 [Halalkalicoccus paucihalophilus]
MRRLRIRNPQSIWDILTVLGLYLLLEYIVLQITGEMIVRQELVIIGIIVVLWVIWAVFQILKKAT